MTNETNLATPPYVSWKSFVGFLDWLGEVGVPSRLDRTFWGKKFSGGYGTQVLAALRFFDLADDENRPTSELDVMAKHEDERKAILGQMLISQYAEVLDGLDLERATAGELTERFRRYPITGETLTKALNFFVQGGQYCNLPLSQHVVQITRRAAKGTPSNTGLGRRGRTPRAPRPRDQQTPNAQVERLGMHPSLEALLRDLNLTGAAWTQDERDRWVTTFTTMLDYVYPVKGS